MKPEKNQGRFKRLTSNPWAVLHPLSSKAEGLNKFLSKYSFQEYLHSRLSVHFLIFLSKWECELQKTLYEIARLYACDLATWHNKRWSDEDETSGRILQCLLRGLERRLHGVKALFSLFSKMHLIYINNGRRVKLRPTEIICTPLSVHETNRTRPRYDLLASLCRPPLYKTNRDRLVSIDCTWTVNL